MSALEKMFVEIFERKNRIIEQVKQQTELYNQHLASKILIEGFNPPSWLFNTQYQSSNPQGLNKEKLISEILLPRPRRPTARYSSARCSLHQRLDDKEDLSHGTFSDIGASTAVYPDNGKGRALNTLPELDASMSSPLDQHKRRVATDDNENLYHGRYSSARCSLHPRPVVTDDKEGLSCGTFSEMSASTALDADNNKEGALNTVPELDASVHSPLEQHKSPVSPDDNQDLSHETFLEIGTSTAVNPNSRKDCGLDTVPDFDASVNSPLDQHTCPDAVEDNEDLYHGTFLGVGASSKGFSPEKGTTTTDVDPDNNKDFAMDPVPEVDVKINSPLDQDKRPEAIDDNEDLSHGTLLELGVSNEGLYSEDGTATTAVDPDKYKESAMNTVPELDVCVHSPLDQHKKPVVTDGNGDLSNRTFSEIGPSYKGLYPKNGTGTTAVDPDDREGDLNILPELDISVKSPLDQTDARVLNNLNDPDLSLARIQRSKSRQKALQLRNSAQAEAKGSPSRQNDSVVSPIGIDLSSSEKVNHYDKLQKWSEPCVVSSGGGGFREAAERNHEDQERGINLYAGDKSNHNSSTKKLECVKDNSDVAEENNTPKVDSSSTAAQESHSSHKNDCSFGSTGSKLIVANSDHDDAHNQQGNTEASTEGPPICRSKSSGSNPKVGPDCSLSGKPKQLAFDGMGECKERSLNKSTIEVSNTSLEAMSEKKISGITVHNRFSWEQSTPEQEISSKLDEVPEISLLSKISMNGSASELKGSYNSLSELHVDVDGNSSDDTEIVSLAKKMVGDSGDCSTKEVEIESLLSISLDAERQSCFPDPKLSCVDGESSHGDICVNGDENLHPSLLSEIKNARASSSFDGRFRAAKLDSWPQVKRKKVEDRQTNYFFTGLISKEFEIGDPTSISPEPNYPNLSCINGDNSHGDLCVNDYENINLSIISDGRFRSAKLESWPQVKRRKTEDRRTNYFSARPLSQMSELYQVRMDAISVNSNAVPEKSGNVVEYIPIKAKISDVGASEKKDSSSKEGIGSSLKLQNKEDAMSYKQQNDSTISASSSDDELLRVSHVSSLFKEPAEMELETGEQKNVQLDIPEEVTFSERTYRTGEQSLYSQPFVCCSPQNKALNIADADPSNPILESFIIDAQTGINYDDLDFPMTTIERASILEKICKSASSDTPLSHFSSALGLHHTQNVYQSLPNGLLEHTDLSSSLFMEDDVIMNQLRATYCCEDEVKDSMPEIPFSDYPPSYRFGWKSGSQYHSPVGKFWGRISSHSSSSEKGVSSNPELMCFPIEEDPNSSEENEAADDVAVLNSPLKKLPLVDVTNSCQNPPASVSAAERFHSRKSPDSVCTGNHSKVKRKLGGSSDRNMSAAKVKQTSLMGAKGIKQGKESLMRSSRQKLSSKSSIKSDRQKLSEKGSRNNNIVSNVTSFIPLVQQKQAAAVCTGKRDIKVKALEAAEAAKRLEDKRANERKMRKEALEHERARLEQENSKQLELEKKKKEEEKKKKEANALERKRQREEEEKNEREKKRKRVEDARRQQKDQEDKTRVKRVEKDKGIPTVDHKKATCSLRKSNGNTEPIAKKNREKSYEISPYRSDAEDDEDEDPPNQKFVPSWASKANVFSVIHVQQGIDHESIFPLESFCSIEEVILPRKLQQRYEAS